MTRDTQIARDVSRSAHPSVDSQPPISGFRRAIVSIFPRLSGGLQSSTEQRAFLRWCAICCTLVATLALVVRLPNCFQRPLGAYADNEDAASHVLATVMAFERVPAAEHHFLPIFTLGAAHDLWIDDLPTASRMTAGGYNYYTSWPPGFFVAAWAIPHAFGVSPSVVSLRALNLGLHYLSAALLALLCHAIVAKLSDQRERRVSAAVVGGLLYLAAPEALRSHLFSYWAEQVFQPILLLQLLLFVRGTSPKSTVAIMLLGVVGGLIDWTAYIANGGLALAFAWRYFQERKRQYLIGTVGLVLANVVGLLLLLAWFSTKLELSSLLHAQRYRAGVRSGGVLDYAKLFGGYFVSFGPFLLLLVPLVSALRRSGSSVMQAVRRVDPRLGPVLLAAGFPLLENLLLANHAASYSYDRLKALNFVAVALAVVIASSTLQRPLVKLAGASALVSVVAFWAVYTFVRPPSSASLQHHKALGELIKDTAQGDEIAFMNRIVRGNYLYYAERNVVQLITDAPSRDDSVVATAAQFLRERRFTRGIVYWVTEDSRQVEITRLSSDGRISESSVLPLP